MNNCHLVQKNAFVACEDVRGGFSERMDPIVCPKPRRVGVCANNPNRFLRWRMSHQVEASDSRAGTELLDLILAKEGASQIASSPPFFSGSPPSRAGNPLTQDARFGEERVSPLSTLSISSPTGVSSPTSSPAHKSGCTRMKFGLKPAAVRVEGFDCLNRDGRSSHIPAFA